MVLLSTPAAQKGVKLGWDKRGASYLDVAAEGRSNLHSQALFTEPQSEISKHPIGRTGSVLQLSEAVQQDLTRAN